MAAETILVVDDNSLNLKVTAITLRSEGYKVHTAANGLQALDRLNSLDPDLMLIDVQMPGMDGLELTRRLKGDIRTKNIIAVALTASNMKSDEENALAAGCDGFITKPIDTRTLGARVRAFLDGRNASTGSLEFADEPIAPAPAAAPPEPARAPATPAAKISKPAKPEPPVPHPAVSEPAPPPKLPPLKSKPAATALPMSAAEIDGLRRRFLVEGIARCRRFLQSLDGKLDVVAASQKMHQWIGAAGLLGYTEIAKHAAEAEELMRMQDPPTLRLREALGDLLIAFSEPSEAAEDPLPEAVVKELAGKRIALVGFDEAESDLVSAALERATAKPRLFEVSEPLHSATIQDCNIIMVHVRPETLGSPWLQASKYRPPRPLVLMGEREHVTAVDRSIQASAAELLIDGWRPDEALLRLSLTLTRPALPRAEAPATPPKAAGRPEILIADDDSTTLTVVRSTLQNYGMNCHVASTGPMALEMIRQIKPGAVVLDINMPGMSGYEVLSAIRAEGLPVRVLLLTARGNETDIVQGFSLGADDYVVKPFGARELVFRLKRLLPQ